MITIAKLLNKDEEWIKAHFDEFFKNKSDDDFNEFLDFIKYLFKYTDNKYSVCGTQLYEDYECEDYIFIVSIKQNVYLMNLGECSCGWDYNYGRGWKTYRNLIFNHELEYADLKVDFKYEK